MPVGANINYKFQGRIMSKMWKLLGFNPMSRGKLKHRRKFAFKAGVPATNTAADNPAAKYDICYDVTNDDLYICTAWTADASGTTWLKFSD